VSLAGNASGDGEPVPIRPAATVMLVRDGAAGLEVCMLRRNLQSDFVGGAYVFPGGGVDPADGEPDVEPLCDGLTDAEASGRLGLPANGLAFWIAAIRETFEEAGLLPAQWADGSPLRFDDPVVAERFVTHRHGVDRRERRLVDIFVEEGLRFPLAEMHYVSHWVTPAGAPRRYDTRFFLAAAPGGQDPVHDDREVIAAHWIRPADALEAHAAGDYAMLPPTVANVRSLSRAGTVAEALAAAVALPAVPSMIPRVLHDGDGPRIVMPGDPHYDRAYSGEESLGTWPSSDQRGRPGWSGAAAGPAQRPDGSPRAAGEHAVAMPDVDAVGNPHHPGTTYEAEPA
jgi:8-oxo-dGTP pyrophosphatase MutT (NUDIX family)